MKVLGIESSCDETACAIFEDGKKICKDPRLYGNPTGYARGLFESGVIPWENEGEKGHKKDINNLRQKISREG